MPSEISTDTATATAYPPKRVYKEWKRHADALDMNVSEFITHMVEAGRKKFEVQVTPDETNKELREQRNDLKQENDRLRERISQLEDQLFEGERGAIIEYVENNPGATNDEIIQRLGDTLQPRVTGHLDELVGHQLREEGGEFYIRQEDHE
jgi:predicted HTH transcriptional regulator